MEVTNALMLSRIPSLGWVLNGWMISAAIVGWFMFGCFGQLQDAWRHKGPVVADYEDDYGSYRREESESEYKRREYGEAGMFLLLSGAVWVAIAKVLRDTEAESQAKMERLEARYQERVAYTGALLDALGPEERAKVVTIATANPEYVEARAFADSC